MEGLEPRRYSIRLKKINHYVLIQRLVVPSHGPSYSVVRSFTVVHSTSDPSSSSVHLSLSSPIISFHSRSKRRWWDWNAGNLFFVNNG